MSRLTLSLLSICLVARLASAQLLPGASALPPVQAPAPPPVPIPAPAPVAPSSSPLIVTAVPTTGNPNALVFDADSKEYHPKPGEESAPFSFNVTNVSSDKVEINSLRTSCGCTVAQLPSQPYTLLPGSNVAIKVTVDLRNKMGVITKSISVDSSAGFKSLLVRVDIPPPTNSAPAGAVAAGVMNDRAKNIQTALVDHQSVFKGECASCHVQKGIGKLGMELYKEDCGICHDSPIRAAMVPDLKVPRTPRDVAFWRKWIEEGKAGTLMPAFAASQGGPLTGNQVDSLVSYLDQTFPRNPPAQQAQARALSLPAPSIP